MSEVKNLEPQIVWKNFHALTRVPRPSGHLEKVQKFLLDWAAEHGIEAFKDGGENIVMRKPATPGMENRKTVVLQAHMDMVPQKTSDSIHDFENDPIETYIDGEWVKAKGTTLGSDDGMGVASIMAVFEDQTLEHGPIEALITADEETCGRHPVEPGQRDDGRIRRGQRGWSERDRVDGIQTGGGRTGRCGGAPEGDRPAWWTFGLGNQ